MRKFIVKRSVKAFCLHAFNQDKRIKTMCIKIKIVEQKLVTVIECYSLIIKLKCWYDNKFLLKCNVGKILKVPESNNFFMGYATC